MRVHARLESAGRDLRLGLRLFRRNAIVTGAAVLSLALALGACLASFSLVDALILRPLPVHRPDRLVYLAFPTHEAERPESDTFNDPLFVRLRDEARGQVDLFAMSTQVMRPVIFPDAQGEKELVRTQYASGDAFERLGVSPAAGRLFSNRDDVSPGTHPVAVISHAFWQRRFGADPSIVGRWFTLDERPFEIVGVTRPEFTGIEPGRPTDVWLPYAMYNPRAFGNFSFNWFRILGRLREGVGIEQTQSVLQPPFMSLRRERMPGLGPGRSPEAVARFMATPLYVRTAINGPSPLRRQFERPLWILGGVAALVLLIAVSNIANLYLARSAAREREMALRLSIGAGRGRLIQQMLVESGLVTAVACAFALLFAAAAAPAVVGMLAPPEDPVHLDLRLNWRVAGFAASLALLTTALFGLLPAVRASGVAPLGALKAGDRSITRPALMRPFVAIQVSLALMVLFLGGLLVLSFARLSTVNPGFAAADVLLVSLDPVRRVDGQEQRAALLRLLDRLRTVPGVQAVSAAEFNVLGRAWTHYVRLPGTPQQPIEVTMAPVTPGYFDTMRIPVVAGRPFADRDVHARPSTSIIVNEAFAARYFSSGTAIGRTVAARFGENDDADVHEVVGVVKDTRYDLRKPAAPTVYIPLRPRGAGTIHVRVDGDPGPIASMLREEARAAEPRFRVTTIRPQSAVVDQTLVRERLLALLAGFFAVVGLLLAALGLYGVLSYSVVQRTREIGIRIALGAQRTRIVWTVLADAGVAVIAGAVCGLAGGIYLSRFISALLFEVRPLSFWSLGLPAGTLLLAGLFAAALPAFRATRVDPAIALRWE